jgi:hypothetical protein
MVCQRAGLHRPRAAQPLKGSDNRLGYLRWKPILSVISVQEDIIGGRPRSQSLRLQISGPDNLFEDREEHRFRLWHGLHPQKDCDHSNVSRLYSVASIAGTWPRRPDDRPSGRSPRAVQPMIAT